MFTHFLIKENVTCLVWGFLVTFKELLAKKYGLRRCPDSPMRTFPSNLSKNNCFNKQINTKFVKSPPPLWNIIFGRNRVVVEIWTVAIDPLLNYLNKTSFDFLSWSEQRFEFPIMGKFGSNFKLLQLREVKRFRQSVFLGSEYFAQRFNRPFDKNPKKLFCRVFLHPKKDILGQKMGL